MKKRLRSVPTGELGMLTVPLPEDSGSVVGTRGAPQLGWRAIFILSHRPDRPAPSAVWCAVDVHAFERAEK